ncbi:MAG: flagellar synthesis regulator FleN, partial [Nitrospirota bacterium]
QDDYVPLAVMRQKALLELFPASPAAQALTRIAGQVLQWPKPNFPKSAVQLLWQRLLHTTAVM